MAATASLFICQFGRRSHRAGLVGVYDANQEASKGAASSFNAMSLGDYQGHLESDIDIVDICTPTPTHFPLANEAIKS